MTNDVYGEALMRFYKKGRMDRPLLLHNSYGEVEEMPVGIFFRSEDELPELEFIALALCDGKILDVGAGVGTHSLHLQEKGFHVTAVEISALACEIMQSRGVNHIIHDDFYHLKDQKYDTLLFLMNGIGIASRLDNLRTLLAHAKTLLNPNGQLLFDSSNISYLYEEYAVERPQHYFGEIKYQYEYKGIKGQPFDWLYIDQETLIRIAHEESWVVQVLYEDEQDQYLVRMEPLNEK